MTSILKGWWAIINIEVSSDKEAGISIITLSGELDLSSKQDMVDLIPEIITGAIAGIIVDVSKLYYIDSAGIEAIFNLLAKAHDRSLVTIFVTDDNSYIQNKFKELGMRSFGHVKIFASVEEARRAIAA